MHYNFTPNKTYNSTFTGIELENKLETKRNVGKIMQWLHAIYIVTVTNLNLFSSGLSIIFDIILINNPISLSLNSMCYFGLFVFFIDFNQHITVHTINNIYLKLLILFVIEWSSSFSFFSSSITQIKLLNKQWSIKQTIYWPVLHTCIC